MRRWLAIALMLIAVPAFADTTAKYTLTNAGWTDLGTGPLLLSFNGIGGVFAISDTTPTLKNEGFGKARGGSIRVVTPSHVWATTKDVFGVTAYVAPITAPATGGGTTSVWTASDAATGNYTITNNGLTLNNTTANAPGVYNPVRSTISQAAGKRYVEFYFNYSATNVNNGFASTYGTRFGLYNYSAAVGYGGNAVSAGFTSNYATTVYPYINDVLNLAIDFTAGKFWYGLNNVWVNGSNPDTGALPIISFVPATVGALFPAVALGDQMDIVTLQATAASQKYAPPGGFQAWDGGTVSPWKNLAATSIGNGGPTIAIDTTGADLLVAFVAGGGAISDNKGNTWSAGMAAANGVFYYCRGCIVGTGHTITQTGGSFPALAFGAFAGSAPSSVDQFAVGAAGTAGPITPTVPNALVVTGNCSNGTRPGDPPPAGFSTLSIVGVGANFGAGLAFQRQTTPAAVTATWAGGNPCGTTIMAFKPQ